MQLPTLLITLGALALLSTSAEAHSRLMSPKARVGEHIGDFTDYRSPPCGDLNGPRSGIRTTATYVRGQSVPIVWPRNNHPGGFIKLSIIPLNRAAEETQAAFDANIVQYSCHESTCKSGFSDDPLGGDADGTPVDGNPCSTSLTIPGYLANGEYTMQWMWFAGGSYFGDVNRGQTSYYGCHDFTIAGGPAVTGSAASCPSFIPGDAHNPASSGKCKFFGSGEPLGCKPDGCSGTYKDGIPPPLGRCLAANGGSSAPSFPAPAPSSPAPPASSSSSAAPAPTQAQPTSTQVQQPTPTASTTRRARRPRRTVTVMRKRKH